MSRYLSFLPSYVIPPLVAMASVYAFTRLLAPAQYGLYALTLSMVQLGLSILFSWLQLGVKRFHVQARERGRTGALAVSIYGAFAVCALLAALLLAGLLPLEESAPQRLAYGLGLGLLLARSLALIGKAFRLSELDARSFGLMECGESLLGFLAALALVGRLGWGGEGVIVGLTIGSLLPILFDLPACRRRLAGGRIDRAIVRDIFRFAAPITYGYALEYVMSSSDRFLIQHFLGEAAVGVYAVSYTLADRGVSLIFQALATLSYPLLMNAKERDGDEAARRQAWANCELLLALTLPAWIGFMVASPHIAAVLTGAAFAIDAARIMPWVGTAVFLSCWRQHYLDHAFHLAQRTNVYIYTAGPPALLNIGLNILLLPRMGTMGAVLATVTAYALAFLISLGLGRRIFPLAFPWATAAKAGLCSLLMAAFLYAVPFPQTPAGLAALLVSGGLVYGGLALGLNLAGLRHGLAARLTASAGRKS